MRSVYVILKNYIKIVYPILLGPAGFYTAAQLGAALFGLVNNTLIAALFGIEAVGKVALFLSLIAIIGVFSNIGLNLSYIKQSKSDEKRLFLTYLIISILVSGMLSILVGFIAFNCLGSSWNITYILPLFSLATMSSAAIAIFTLKFRYHKSYFLLSLVKLFPPLFLTQLLLFSWALSLGSSPYSLHYIQLVSFPLICSGILIFLFLFREKSKIGMTELNDGRSMLWGSRVFLPILLASYLVDSGVYIFVGTIFDETSAGVFAYLWKFALLMSFGIDSQQALYGRSMILRNQNQKSFQFENFAKEMFILSLFLVISGIFVYTIIGKFIIYDLYDNLIAIVFVGFAVLYSASKGPVGFFLLLNGHEKKALNILIVKTFLLAICFLIFPMIMYQYLSIVDSLALGYLVASIGSASLGSHLVRKYLNIDLALFGRRRETS